MTQDKPLDSDPTVDMDDTTGSNGGPTNDRFSGEADTASEEQGDDYTHSSTADKPRSDTARVDGPGISGGTGDADSSQSGGRSQY
ncbi:hypothetical protein EXU85_04310 [Spirosoma sp. KCTC 42546]|uniref:hypothetical protein n=1 Tax=Spirosoma sp. KCTC 42546 TaxID=2520506 RepID=UPI00115C1539|nr:hypothetical protein [Spirosoma sp. KCTC 42546]QDK77853.1 hypothetical protein EXU85_04310 [Spirosoma sp. KCTC 42546]